MALNFGELEELLLADEARVDNVRSVRLLVPEVALLEAGLTCLLAFLGCRHACDFLSLRSRPFVTLAPITEFACD